MGLRFKDQIFGTSFFITTSFRDRIQFGNIAGVYEQLADTLSFELAKTKSKLIAYALMPSHIHLFLFVDGKLLAGFMRDFKKFTAQKSLPQLCRTRRLWQYRYDRQAIISKKLVDAKIAYIHNNPVRAGMVEYPEDWKWSSAADYLGRTNGPVPVSTDWYCV
jgi:REP element-mobilizing transposase RayT